MGADAAPCTAVTPGTTRAQSITFTVVGGEVPGTPDNTFEADLLNGGYSASLVLTGDGNPTDGTGSGTWSATAAAAFSQYLLGGTALVNPFIGDVERAAPRARAPDGYLILVSLTLGGTYVEDTCGVFNCIILSFTSQTGSLGIDTDQDGDVDVDLLSASGVGVGTVGSIIFSGGPTGGTGSFVSNFANNTVGWDRSRLLANARVDHVHYDDWRGRQPNVPAKRDWRSQCAIHGDSGRGAEPATLTLLALAWSGSPVAARQRRAT